MILSNIKGITIPEGAVKQIADSAGRVLWKAAPSSIVPGLVIGYSGDYTDQADVVMADGKHYRLLTLTGSGTLTLDQSVKADVWLCAGGNGGRGGGKFGGGGGKFTQSDDLQLDTSTVCTIGAGATGAASTQSSSASIGGTTTFGSLRAVQETGTYRARHGASGGGDGGNPSTSSDSAGNGGGLSTVPFVETAVFDPHSAGGGGGGYSSEGNVYTGGAGGSDGAGGGASGTGSSDGGHGGVKGGGAGGTHDNNGSDATFYGSGGGGGGTSSKSGVSMRGGAGYQGVIYVRIPYEQ